MQIRSFCSALVVFMLVVLTSNAQVNLASSEVLINEIGFEKGTQPGFIELILVGGSTNIGGWTIDNLSNSNFQDNGRIGFSSNFPQLPPGTPIVVYNSGSNFSWINPSMDNQLTEDGFYQLLAIY